MSTVQNVFGVWEGTEVQHVQSGQISYNIDIGLVCVGTSYLGQIEKPC